MSLSQTSPDDSQLITDLLALSKKSPKLVKSSTYPAPGASEIIVRSWKMNEFKYYDIPSPFPTLARGLFSIDGSGSDMPSHRIVVRGYDKFFNIGEVPWTTWEAIEAHTAPPYTLSLKSNGCIIFIAALTPALLLVTSKHSLGPVSKVEESHAQAGHRWLRTHLERAGHTEEELAQTLWDNNWTAVAELCDDSFEEHVLPYAPEKTGLHLHGLNRAQRDFSTLAPTEVDAFAEKWGFIRTPTTVLDSVPAVRAFTNEVSKTGTWRGEALEGFVVRTRVTAPPTEGKNARTGRSPYAEGASFFFKVKFDEPYMMYRDWRELTKMLLSAKDDMRLPKAKMRRPETKVYVRWVKGEIERDRKAFDGYSKGKGVIATRERFLKWTEDGVGHVELEKEKETKDTVQKSDKQYGKTIIMPIAIPGCGKTAVSVALAHLFGFAHTQSDDVHVKKAAPVFIKNVVSLLKDHDVVIADKNNHLRQHREELRTATAVFSPPVRLLALNWFLDKPHATLQRVCGDRVQSRGANHQTLRADPDPARAHLHEHVLSMFINNAESFAESEADVSVDIDVEATLEEMLATAVDACVEVLGVERPSKGQIEEALEAAQAYKPKKKSDEPKKKKDGELTARYFGLLPELDLAADVGPKLLAADGVAEGAKDFWRALVSAGRVTQRPHVTIVHKNELPGSAELWERCSRVRCTEKPPLFRLTLGHAVWDGRVMAVTVDDVAVEGEEGGEGQEGSAFVAQLGHEIRERLHVTVGTRDDKVPAVEAKGVVERWRKGEVTEGGGALKLEGVVTEGRVKGFYY